MLLHVICYCYEYFLSEKINIIWLVQLLSGNGYSVEWFQIMDTDLHLRTARNRKDIIGLEGELHSFSYPYKYNISFVTVSAKSYYATIG
jgi:hypothetical protein